MTEKMDTGDNDYVQLGQDHFFYIDDMCEIDLGFYLTWSDQQKADVRVSKFGAPWGRAPTPIDFIHHPSGHTTFKAMRRSWPDQRPDGFKYIDSTYKKSELVDDVATLIRGKKFLYQMKVFTNKKNHTGFILYPPHLMEDEDFQTLVNYVNLTR